MPTTVNEGNWNASISLCLLLSSSCMGVGTLTLPWAYKQSGLIPGIIISIFTGIICGFTMVILTTASHAYNARDYSELIYCILTQSKRLSMNPYCSLLSVVSAYCNMPTTFVPIHQSSKPLIRRIKCCMRLFETFIFIDCLVITVCFMMFQAEFIPSLMEAILNKIGTPTSTPITLGDLAVVVTYGIAKQLTKKEIVVLCVILFCFLACLPKDVMRLKHLSLISVVLICITSMLLLIRSAELGIENIHDDPINYFNFSWQGLAGTIHVSNLVVFIFFCHFNIIPAGRHIKPANLKKILLIVIIAVGYGMIFNVLIAIVGYNAFRSQTKQNVMRNFPTNDSITIMIRLGFVIVLFIMIPLEVMPMVSSFLNLISKDYGLPPTKRENVCSIKEKSFLLSNNEIELQNEFMKTLNMPLVSNASEILNNRKYFTEENHFCEENTIQSVCFSLPTPLASKDEESICKESCNKFIIPNISLSSNEEEDNIFIAPLPQVNILPGVSAPRFIKTETFRNCCTLTLLFICGAISLYFTSIVRFVQLAGGTIDSFFIFLVPAYIYYQTFANTHKTTTVVTVVSGLVALFVVESLTAMV